MNNKQIVKQFIDNLFVNNDKAYEVVADNVRVNWPGFGMDDITSKENLRKFLDEGGPYKVLEQKLYNLISEEDTVIGDGTIITERNGSKEVCHFADVYKIKNGKITELQSYMVMEKSNKK